jgi:MoaA/NifB/PqqE/SkfB family radical SAM enzyme
VFIATGQRLEKLANQELANAGFTFKRDFEYARTISPLIATVEVSGLCNLRCIACPQGSGHSLPKGGFMTAENYKKVLDKMVKEIPFLWMIELFMWGEPLLNPELPEIIRISNEKGVGVNFSTNLNYGKNIEEVVKAGPMDMRIAVSGYGPEHYEITHTGAKWEDFYQNLLRLREYMTKYDSNIAAQVWYHVNKLNAAEYKDMQKLCKELGFELGWIASMVFPPFMMDYIEKKPLSPEVRKAMDLMPVGPDEMLLALKKEHDKPCYIRLGVPTINWDMSVLTCPGNAVEILAPNYLDIPLEEIIEKRNRSLLCDKCVEYSLHRHFTGRPHVEYIKKLLKDAGAEI